MEKLFIISNESVFNYEGNFFCDNIDLKSTPEGLNKKFQVNLIARKSTDVVSAGILDPVSVIRQSISGANEATISVLRIDDVLWAQQDPQVPDEVQERLDASNQFA